MTTKKTIPKVKKPPLPEYVLRAKRALLRAGKAAQAEAKRHGLGIIVWKNGKVVEQK
jgi:hypothetical protein